jgi:plasmid stabilization system protein ParE
MRPVRFHDQAKAELDEAAEWYERKKPGLGGEFRAAVEETVERIRMNPLLGFKFARTRFRYRLVPRFPYVVFYGEHPQVIRVMAVAHGSRRPGYWRRRAEEE